MKARLGAIMRWKGSWPGGLKPTRMGAYAYLEGDALAEFIFAVRDGFVTSEACARDDAHQANSMRLVALDVFEGKSLDERLRVVRDLLASNLELVITRDSREIFAHADTPAAFISDLACEVACQVLARDPAMRAEDGRRLRLAAGGVGLDT